MNSVSPQHHLWVLAVAVAVASCAGAPLDAGAYDAGAPMLTGLIVASDSDYEYFRGPGNIFVVKPDGTGKCYLTNDGNVNSFAGWSYDGTKIAYTMQVYGDARNPIEIWTMDANGENKKQLTFPPSNPLAPAFALAPAFSPDGTHIVYLGGSSGSAEVWVMNANGTNQERLTTTTQGSTTRGGTRIQWSELPFYSPDGTKIVYSSTQSGSTQIWVMNADGTNQTELTFLGNPTAPDANFPTYSPDGSKIVFWSGYEGEYGQIWVMNADGSNRTQLTFEPDGVSSDEPAWSADGKSIIFDSTRDLQTPGAGQAWIMNADGSSPRVLFPHLYGEGRNPWRNDPVQAGGPKFQCRNR